MSTADIPHGTYAGWQRHRRHGVPTCADCRKAQAEYMATWRAKNPPAYAAERRMMRIRSRALWRLANLHPAEFRALVEDEDRADRQAAS